jgi:branched-chain amino acid transport system substrate-binding protein
MTTKRWFSVVVAVVAVLGFGVWYFLHPKIDAMGPRSVGIGVLLPLTGDAAVYGRAIKNGIELALAQAASNQKDAVNLLYEDDRSQATAAVSAAQKLINLDKVPAIVGGAMSSTAEAIIPICDANHVVLVSPTATKPSLIRMGQYFFRLWPSDDYDGKVMAETAYNKLGLRRIGILYVNLAYGLGIAQVFEREFKKFGGTISSSDGYPQGATDFRTLLTRIAGTRPDAIYLPGYVGEVTQILKQAKELGLKIRFLGVNSLYDPKLVEVAGDAAEGAIFTYPTFDTKSQDPAVVLFVQEYRAKYGSDPDAFAAQGYDSLRVLLRALATGAMNGQAIRDALLTGGVFEGPGGSFTFDRQGDVEKPLRLLEVKDGRFVQF